MNASVQEFLSTFDNLTEQQRLEIISEILNRFHLDLPALSNEDLVWNAEEFFLELDRQESTYK